VTARDAGLDGHMLTYPGRSDALAHEVDDPGAFMPKNERLVHHVPTNPSTLKVMHV
jgi:hypothetical protein